MPDLQAPTVPSVSVPSLGILGMQQANSPFNIVE
jgi:hypothetical protein